MFIATRGPQAVLILASCAAVMACQAAAVAPHQPSPAQPGAAPSSGGNAPAPGIALPNVDAAPATVPVPGDQTCAAVSVSAERAKVDLLFLVDVSSSMSKIVPGGTLSKLQMARDALVAFMRDAGSAELSAAVQFFPVRAKCFTGVCVGPVNPPGPTPPCPCPAGLTCMPTAGASPMACPGNPPSCQVADYRSPSVGFAAPATIAAPTLMAFAGQDPLAGASGTPTGPALLGAFEQLRARTMANPGHRGAVVVISDGTPTLCEPLATEALAAPIEAARQTAPAIPTFFIGVYAAANLLSGAGAVVERLARAGGTTPFVLDPAQDITRRLQDAFSQIRTLAVPCDLAIPAPPGGGTIDFARVNLHVTSAGKEADVPYVQSPARCQPGRGGWHYDADPATGGKPTRIVMCPDTCKSLQDDATAKADLRFGCRTIGID